ncbi:MAG TPA: POTRA domain-containing protein [Pirellulaceae bacterium]|jgi:outer membrane protein assembly factor BamA
MRYKLRTLLIVLALGPLLLSIAYFQFQPYLAWRKRKSGPLIRQARFLGNRAFSDKKLLKVAGVHESIRLNPYTASQSLRKLQTFYSDQGYLQAQIAVLEGNRPRDKTLAFQITEGRQKSP